MKAKDILADVCMKGKMSTVIRIPEELRKVAKDIRKEEAGDIWKDLEEAEYVIRSNGVGEEEKESVMRNIQEQEGESEKK